MISGSYFLENKKLAPFNTSNCSAPFLQCLGEVKAWMSSNFNKNKTKVITFGQSCNPSTSLVNLHSIEPFIKLHAKNVGVIIDRKFAFEKSD